MAKESQGEAVYEAGPSGDHPREGSLKEHVLGAIPSEWQVRLLEAARDLGIRGDNDPGWLLIHGYIGAWAGAAESGRSAARCEAAVEELRQLLADIPEKVNGSIAQATTDAVGQVEARLEHAMENKINALNTRFEAAARAVAEERRRKWHEMLEGFDRRVEQIASEGEASLRHGGQGTHLASRARWRGGPMEAVVIGVVLVALGVGLTIGGGWLYFDRCGEASDGTVVCVRR